MQILPKMKTLLIVMALFVGCYAIEFKHPDTEPCIRVQMNANLSLTMTNTASNATKNIDGVLDGYTSDGSCGDTPELDVVFNPTSDFRGTLAFKFSKSSDSKVSMVITYTFGPDTIFKNNDQTPQTLTSASVPLSSDNTSYTCTAAKEIMFNTGTSTGFKYEFEMLISQVQIQAYKIKDGKFSPADDCTAADMTTEAPVPSTQQVTTQPPATTTEPLAPTTQPQPKNETTTEAPVTTKNATSEAPTTSVVPTTVTTTEPPTTIVTTVVPTTTMNPGPTPKPGSPDTNTYTADTVNTTCLLLKAGIEFTVKYVATGGASKTVVVGIPKGFTVKGNCNGTNTTQSLSVSFYNNLWILTMIFAESSDQFYMSGVDLNAVLDSSVIKDINNTVPVKINKMFGSDQFSAAKDGSYKCSADTTLTLDDKISMNTYNLQYAAFQTFPKNTTDFTGNNISECSGDTTTNSVVPIAVGAALAGLVVIVLIAYLIGRRRSRAAGYEQV